MMYFIGNPGEFFPGVPARDLTKPEWDALDEQTRAALLSTKMFSGKAPEGHKPKTVETEAPTATPAKGG